MKSLLIVNLINKEFIKQCPKEKESKWKCIETNCGLNIKNYVWLLILKL